jgi:hypothetical protein
MSESITGLPGMCARPVAPAVAAGTAAGHRAVGDLRSGGTHRTSARSRARENVVTPPHPPCPAGRRVAGTGRLCQPAAQAAASPPDGAGLPADSTLTAADLAGRAGECLGVREPAAHRTPEHARKLKTIVDVLKIPERSVIGHLDWGTFTLRDVVARNAGVSPFGNEGVRCVGSADDAALNAGVPRFKADPQAVARFSADVDHRGRFAVPVLSGHGNGDATGLRVPF